MYDKFAENVISKGERGWVHRIGVSELVSVFGTGMFSSLYARRKSEALNCRPAVCSKLKLCLFKPEEVLFTFFGSEAVVRSWFRKHTRLKSVHATVRCIEDIRERMCCPSCMEVSCPEVASPGPQGAVMERKCPALKG